MILETMVGDDGQGRGDNINTMSILCLFITFCASAWDWLGGAETPSAQHNDVSTRVWLARPTGQSSHNHKTITTCMSRSFTRFYWLMLLVTSSRKLALSSSSPLSPTSYSLAVAALPTPRVPSELVLISWPPVIARLSTSSSSSESEEDPGFELEFEASSADRFSLRLDVAKTSFSSFREFSWNLRPFEEYVCVRVIRDD